MGRLSLEHTSMGTRLNTRSRLSHLRVDAVGAGLQARRRIPQVVRSGDEIVAVCDFHGVNARKLVHRYGCSHYKCWEVVVTKNDIDAISFAPRPSSHSSTAIRVMEGGKHDLCEQCSRSGHSVVCVC